MEEDTELKAMSTAYEALKSLDQQAQIRIMAWLHSKFGTSAVASSNATPEQHAGSAARVLATDIASFATLAELFAEAAPDKDVEKALLVSAYIQEKSGKTDLVSREIQAELHNLGFRVTNITSTITNLMNRKPQLMIQTRKEGKSRQAQKKYRVTVAGLNVARAMLTSTQHAD